MVEAGNASALDAAGMGSPRLRGTMCYGADLFYIHCPWNCTSVGAGCVAQPAL